MEVVLEEGPVSAEVRVSRLQARVRRAGFSGAGPVASILDEALAYLGAERAPLAQVGRLPLIRPEVVDAMAGSTRPLTCC